MQLTPNNVYFLTDVFASLAKLNYCLLRNYESLPIEIGKDIDILIDFESVNKAVEKVQLISINRGYSFKISDNELNGFNVVVEGEGQKMNIHFQLRVSFETNFIYKKVPGLSEKIINSQVHSRSVSINYCILCIPCVLDELVLLLRQIEFKYKKSYEDKIIELTNNSKSTVIQCAKRTLALNDNTWVTNSSLRSKLIVRLIWQVWDRQTLRNFFRALIFVIKRKL